MQAPRQASHYFAGNLRKIKTSFIGNQRMRLGFIVAVAALSPVDELMRPFNNGPTVARMRSSWNNVSFVKSRHLPLMTPSTRLFVYLRSRRVK